MALTVLCFSRICCSHVNCTAVNDSKQSISKTTGLIGGTTLGYQKFVPCGSVVNWKKHTREKVGFCGFVMKSSLGVKVGNITNGNALSSEEVIRVLKSISDPDEGFAFFKSVAELPYVVHTTDTCNYTLELLKAHGRIGDMAVVFGLMQKQIIYRSLDTYLTIFKSIHVRGGIRKAPFALQRMRVAGFVLNAYSYNGLIHFILQSGYCKEALEVYRRAISEGIKPSLKAYSALMVAFGKRRDTDSVMGLLKEMGNLGLQPNAYTFNICIRVLGTTGKIVEAFGILKRMDEEGCEPDVITYTVLIEALCNAGKLDKAKDVLTKMKSSRHKPDRVTYITLLNKFSERGDLNAVRQLWSQMEADGYAADVVTFTILVDCLCKIGKVDEAFDTLDNMRNKAISPNLHTYNTLIGGLLRVNRLNEALTLFDSMESLGIKQTAYTYILFIDYYGKSGEQGRKCIVIWGKKAGFGEKSYLRAFARVNPQC